MAKRITSVRHIEDVDEFDIAGVARRIVRQLRRYGSWVTRSELHRALGNVRADDISRALRFLHGSDVVKVRIVETSTKPAEMWCLTDTQAYEPRPKNRAPRTTEAMEWLCAVLEQGPQYTTDILAAATEDGISHGTLRLAKTALGVVARKDPGGGGAWTWQMPEPAAPSVSSPPETLAVPVPDKTQDTPSADHSVSLDDKLLRAAEIAAFLQVSKSRAYELMADGTLPVLRIGRSIRVSRKSLERWLREQEAK